MRCVEKRDVPVCLSVLILVLFSLFNLLFPQVWISRGLEPPSFFLFFAVAAAIILAARILVRGAERRASASLRALMDRQPRTATVRRVKVCEGVPLVHEMELAVDRLVPGDVIVVQPGMPIPVDGVVSSGECSVDERLLTGALAPVQKEAGDRVYVGSVNLTGSIHVRTEKTGGDTLFAGIIRTAREAADRKAPVRRLLDRVTSIPIFAILGVAVLTLLGWLFLNPF